MNYYLNEKINIKNVEKIIFFDIDQTLTSVVNFCTLSLNENHNNLIKDKYYNKFKTLKLCDIGTLERPSVALFAELLKTTNSKAFCIASWSNVQQGKLNINEIMSLFSDFADFPDDWLIGCSFSSCLDRYSTYILPIIEKINFEGKFAVIDDGGFNYIENKNTVIVDGRLGFTIYDFFKVLDILEISKIKSPLNYYFQNFKEERKNLK